MQKQILWIFSDVHNTYTSSFGQNKDYKNNRIEELKNFKKILLEISKIYKCDQIWFSFITSENLELLKKHIDEFTNIIENTIIKFKKNYFKNKKYYKDDLNNDYNKEIKAEIIISEMIKNIDQIKVVIYIDDNEFEHLFFEELLKRETTKPKIVHNIKHKKLGLSGVNEALKKHKKINNNSL